MVTELSNVPTGDLVLRWYREQRRVPLRREA